MLERVEGMLRLDLHWRDVEETEATVVKIALLRCDCAGMEWSSTSYSRWWHRVTHGSCGCHAKVMAEFLTTFFPSVEGEGKD